MVMKSLLSIICITMFLLLILIGHKNKDEKKTTHKFYTQEEKGNTSKDYNNIFHKCKRNHKISIHDSNTRQ